MAIPESNSASWRVPHTELRATYSTWSRAWHRSTSSPTGRPLERFSNGSNAKRPWSLIVHSFRPSPRDAITNGSTQW